MSAWLVSKAHVDALVQSAVVEGLVPTAEATPTGQMLWRENMLSLAARYNDPVDDAAIAAYAFEGVEAPLDDAVIFRNIGCYDYQSCEHAEWEQSEACGLVDRLGKVIADRHPEWERYEDGTADAPDPEGGSLPWGIDSIDQAVAR